jgi:hypothetical protein
LVKNKVLYLTNEEYVYLEDLGLIQLKEDRSNNNDMLNNTRIKDVYRSVLYNYLRRAAKLITCCEHNDNTLKDYFIVYETIENFRQKKPDYIIKLFKSKKFTTGQICDYLKVTKTIDENAELVLAIVSSSFSITFIKAKTIIPINK